MGEDPGRSYDLHARGGHVHTVRLLGVAPAPTAHEAASSPTQSYLRTLSRAYLSARVHPHSRSSVLPSGGSSVEGGPLGKGEDQ